MKTRNSKKSAFTFLEIVIVLVVIVLLVLLLLPPLARSDRGGPRIACVRNLKEIVLAFAMWAHDNGDAMPMSVSTNQGGTKEYNETGQVFRHFLVVTNGLNTPRVLGCPTDKARTRVKTWAKLNNQNISYFVGLDAAQKNPQMVLSGDRNIIGGLSANGNIMVFNTNSTAGWTKELHRVGGNIGFVEGYVDMVADTELRKYFGTNGLTRLAIP